MWLTQHIGTLAWGETVVLVRTTFSYPLVAMCCFPNCVATRWSKSVRYDFISHYFLYLTGRLHQVTPLRVSPDMLCVVSLPFWSSFVNPFLFSTFIWFSRSFLLPFSFDESISNSLILHLSSGDSIFWLHWLSHGPWIFGETLYEMNEDFTYLMQSLESKVRWMSLARFLVRTFIKRLYWKNELRHG